MFYVYVLRSPKQFYIGSTIDLRRRMAEHQTNPRHMSSVKGHKSILVLNYEFPPLGGGASPVSYELAKRLSDIFENVVHARLIVQMINENVCIKRKHHQGSLRSQPRRSFARI